MAISALRTVIIYAVLVAGMRVMGKRQLGDLQPSELVVTLLVADMAAACMQDIGTPLLYGLIPLGVLVSLELLLSGLTLKFPGFARLVGGSPVLLIHEGRLDQAAMRRLRMTVEDVLAALRGQGIFDIADVQCAVVETGGNVSVLQKPGKRPATAEDVGKTPGGGTPFLILKDGRICENGLSLIGRDEKWLRRLLKKEGCRQTQVFLLTADRGGAYYLAKKEKT